jgi:prepilin-type N-terminal cleavage/methylation domain-containing protein
MRIPNNNKGFTLAEVVIAMSLSVFVAGFAYATILALAKGSESMINFTEMNAQTRLAIENFGRDARMAEGVLLQDFSSTNVILRVPDPNTGVPRDIRYHFDESSKVFTRQIWETQYSSSATPDSSRILVTHVDAVNFNGYTVLNESTSHPPDIKHIQLEALLKRRVLSIENTNYIISARFMLRNKNANQ